jgi:hypothetical protein
MSHLAQGQAEPPRLRHEGQHVQHLGGIESVARRRAARRREYPSRLVQPERLAAESALGRYLANPEPLRHVLSLRPAPRGRVKHYFRSRNSNLFAAIRVDGARRPIYASGSIICCSEEPQ